jgi:nucleotide-binding universal stress UspA family protein
MIKILVPVDGSACALAATRHAAFLYREGGVSEVMLLNVQPPLEFGRAGAVHSLASLRELERREGERALAVARDILDDSGVPYVTMIGVGALASTVAHVAESRGYDGIIVGSGLWGQIKACFGAGLPERLMRRTRVPVTVVKALRLAGAGPDAALTHPPHAHPHAQLEVYPSGY